MRQYLSMLERIVNSGIVKPQRAEVEGKKLAVKSIFAPDPLRFDLSKGFPIITTKPIPFGQVATELLWFLRGDTNIKFLNDRGCHIWDEWADNNGDLGPVYGEQWRHWDAGQEGGKHIWLDQIVQLLVDIREVRDNPEHPAARRLILCSWNPAAIFRMGKAPPFCHSLAQFNVTGEHLNCQMYQRSADMFLGVPWNISCYALLTHLFADICGLIPGVYTHAFGDAHLYENSWDVVRDQLTRKCFDLPELRIWQNPLAGIIAGVPMIARKDYAFLHNYMHHPLLERVKVAI